MIDFESFVCEREYKAQMKSPSTGRNFKEDKTGGVLTALLLANAF